MLGAPEPDAGGGGGLAELRMGKRVKKPTPRMVENTGGLHFGDSAHVLLGIEQVGRRNPGEQEAGVDGPAAFSVSLVSSAAAPSSAAATTTPPLRETTRN